MSRPLKGPIGLDSAWQFQGQAGDASQTNPWANVETVTPGYLAAMGMRLLEGRLLDARDADGAQRAVLVSRSLAQFAWPGQSAIGRQLRTAALDDGQAPRWWTVVGVVGDVRYRELASVPLDVYVTAAQSPFIAGDLMVRLSEPVERMAPLVRARLREVNADGAITIDVMGDVLDAHRAPWTANMALFGLFAGLTLVLAVIGLYALMASTVSERVREIAVRLTLGATPRGIVTELIWFGARLTAAGVVVGVMAALAGAGIVRSLLFEISPLDASTLTAAPALLALVALLACLIPSLRASRTDPAITLRSE
jgi:hypothetical protein